MNRKAAKILALSSEKTDKYEYFIGEGILPSNQRYIIEQAVFAYPLLRKTFEKETIKIKDQGVKQIKANEDNKEQPDNKQQDNNELFLSKEREISKNI